MPYDLGPSIESEFKPTLDAYSENAQAGFGQDMGGVRRDASRELEGEIMGQDLQGRQAGFLRKDQSQQFGEAQNRFDSDLGMKRAELGETLRGRGQDRMWQVQDRDFRLARLRKQADEQRKIAHAAQGNEMMGATMGAIGTVAGGVIGGYFGNAPGAIAGAGAGGAAGGAIGNAM